MKTALAAVLAALALPAVAAPDACAIVTLDEVNAISTVKAEKVQPQKSGNPSQCGFMDPRKAAVVVVSVREVQYAARDEMHYERENLEKIYKMKSKPVDTIGDGGFWLPANKQLTFRKGKVIVSVTFAVAKHQNEVDSSQLARVIEAKLPK